MLFFVVRMYYLAFITNTVFVEADINDLFRDLIRPNVARKEIRPVADQMTPVNVSVGFNLLAIGSVDGDASKIIISGWWEVKWSDPELRWNESLHSVKFIEGLEPYIWIPKLVVLKSPSELTALKQGVSSMQLSSQGEIKWLSLGSYELVCNGDILTFPFDQPTCSMTISGWGYNFNQIHLAIEEGEIDADSYMPGGEWSLVSTSIEHLSNISGKSEQTSQQIIQLSFILERRETFFIFSFVLPIANLAIMNNFVYLVPSSSGEKLSFAIIIPLSYSVYMGYLSSYLPKTSSGMSVFAIFLAISLLNSTLNILFTVWIMNMYERDDEKKPVPAWLVKFLNGSFKRNLFCCKGRLVANTKVSGIDETPAVNDTAADLKPVTWKQVSRAINKLLFFLFFIPTAIAIPAILAVINVSKGLQ
ncbi:hypothetical protein SNE40_022758 [Patella caerulea]|uniref:Uncharacterized protein n=1 Tax=Patella caerulea TaxID=87958 RepID=A0AAN8GFZ1_PATCE